MALPASSDLKKEAEKIGIVTDQFSARQLKLLEQIKNIDKEPIRTKYPGTQRTPDQLLMSQSLNKRVNSGYVDMPYKATSEEAFRYTTPPDFSRAYLKKKSDCDFQGYANEAILKHVDLKKTSH